MHGQAYLRKAIIAHLDNALEEYLWLASQVPADHLDGRPAGAARSVREQILDLAVELDVVAYPRLLALLEGCAAPPPIAPDLTAARGASYAAADLMEAMKQMRYRFEATEALLRDTTDVDWGSHDAGPTALALEAFTLWRELHRHLDTLATTVLTLLDTPAGGPGP